MKKEYRCKVCGRKTGGKHHLCLLCKEAWEVIVEILLLGGK